MKTVFYLLCLIILPFLGSAQGLQQKLDAALQRLQQDSQAIHSIVSLYVVNSKTGLVLYDMNGDVGLAPASSQKVITSAAAMELLGKEFVYKTTLGYNGKIIKGVLQGDIIITGSGDPSLGSWRYVATKEESVLTKMVAAIQAAGIKSVEGSIKIFAGNWETQTIPGGWTWDDIGNYYGAGAGGINWRENQYDLVLKPGKKEGDSVTIVRTKPFLYNVKLQSELTTGKKGSGDNSIIFLSPQSTLGVVRGTIPLGVDSFVVSGSVPNPPMQLEYTLSEALMKKNIRVIPPVNKSSIDFKRFISAMFTPLATFESPSLDSLNYWFLKRSVNLYGEALVKTIGYEKAGYGSTDSGLAVIKRFWNQKGIDPTAINMLDGSGLSPQNRITTKALVSVMQYAKSKSWFPSFYNALPEINNIKMKSGSIGGARSFTGYLKRKEEDDLTFAVIINGYTGSSVSIVRKLYSLLDLLK